MNPGAPIQILLEDLINAVADHCSFSYYYLDRETGEIIFQSERRHPNDADDAPELDTQYPGEDTAGRFIPVEPMESRRGHELMKLFIATLDDGIQSVLSRAISKQKPFRNFKDVIYDYPDIQENWHAYYAKEIKTIVEEWLQYNHINYEFVTLKDLMKL
jgi:hypothetical protein